MASVSIDKRNGRVVVKAYAGRDPQTGRQSYLRRSFDPGTPKAVIDQAVDELDARAAAAKGKGGAFTLDDLVDAFLKSKADRREPPGTRSAYRCWYRHVAGEIGKLPADEVRPQNAAAAVGLCLTGAGGREPVSLRTANYIRAVLHAAYEWGIANGMVHFDPITFPRLKEGPRPRARALDADELARALPWMAHPAAGWDDLCARRGALLALHAGLRVGEVCALRSSDVDWADMSVTVERSVSEKGGLHLKAPKGGKARRIALDLDCMDALRELADRNAELFGASAESLLCDARGRLRRPSSMSRAFAAGMDDVGVGCTRFHCLRHTHATYLAAQGVPLADIARRLGHASISTTAEVYMHALPAVDRAAAESFGGAMGGGRHGGA